ncbi:MAG: hypothetical protein JXB39_05570 [Deltaproteobacteria bacterium]|nr:hypothetical protein [Deltaproteobacteria bacterium]
MRRIPAVSALVFLAACGPSRDNFIDAYIETVCEKVLECQEEDDSIQFDDQAECEGFFGVFIDDDAFEDCDYDKGAARDCLDAIEELDCDFDEEGLEAVDACEDVWDCTDSDDTGWDSGWW